MRSLYTTLRSFPASKCMAGVIGLVLVSCGPSQSVETPNVPANTNVVLMDSDFDGKDLVKGMDMQEAMKNLEFLGWEYSKNVIHVSAAGMTNLWLNEPCRAAAFKYSQSYKSISTERPPKNLILNAAFFECVEGEPINIGQLAKVEIKEDIYAKNK